MKKRTLLYSLLALIVAAADVMPALAQVQNQYAIYNYRNDGDFNAWLNIDVDSITYSCVDTLGVTHDDVVVQEVWTPDTLYRIPIAAIDSIGFRAPQPEFQDNVFHITAEHLPYITNVNNLMITFSSSLPQAMRPKEGQVITSDTFEEPLVNGFAGKIKEVIDDGQHFYVACEAAQITDVFKKLLLVGKAYGVDEEEAKSRPLRKPRGIWDPYEDGDHAEFEFPGEFKVKVNDWLTIKDELTLSADYYVYVDFPRFKVSSSVTGKHDVKVDWSIVEVDFLELLGYEKDDEPSWGTAFYPVVAIPGVFSFGVKAGAFFDPSVKLELEGSTPFTFTHTLGMEFSNKDQWSWIPLIKPIVDADLDFGTPEISLTLEGKLFAGVALGLKARIVSDDVLLADVTGRFGPEIDAKMEMKTEVDELDNLNLYSLMKESKMGVQMKADVKTKVKAFNEDLGKFTDKLAWDWIWPIEGWEYWHYLFPEFTQPELYKWDDPQPLSMFSDASRNLIMPAKLGMRLYDNHGGMLREKFCEDKYWVEWTENKMPDIFVGELEPGYEYICKPVFNLPLLGVVEATPTKSFVAPYPVTASPKEVTINVGETEIIEIQNGWDQFAVAFTGGDDIASFINDNDADARHIKVKGMKIGATALKIEDRRTKETVIVPITVTDGTIQPLHLAANTLSIKAGGQGTVAITSGNGPYTASSDNAVVATAAIDGQTVVVVANKAGTANITVTDTKTNATATIAVTVTEDEQDAQGCPDGHHPHMIDLGLPSGTKWACCNVGASMPTDEGGHYAWGETGEKSEYTWDNYKWYTWDWGMFDYIINKYNTNPAYGTVDNKTVLDAQDDVAQVLWGGSWHMPGYGEMQELMNYCSSSLQTIDGKNVMMFEGNNGARILIPVVTYIGDGVTTFEQNGQFGLYFTNTLITNAQEAPGEQTNNFFVYGMYFDSTMKSWIQTDRTLDASIRAVSSSSAARSDVNNNAAASGDTQWLNTTHKISNMKRK